MLCLGVVCGFGWGLVWGDLWVWFGVLRCSCVLFVEWFCWFVIVWGLVWFWFVLLFVFDLGVCFGFSGGCLG